MIHNLGLKIVFHSYITVVNFLHILQLSLKIPHPRPVFSPDKNELILQIAYHQSHNEQLCHPHIGIVIHQNIETAPLPHLSRNIPGHCQKSGHDSLLLSIDHSKQQHI